MIVSNGRKLELLL